MTMGRFYVASPAAGFLMLPYLGWTCFATTLINCSLWDSNPAVVQSAHKFAQVKPQDQSADSMTRAKSGHTRNKTAPGDLGRVEPQTEASDAGGIHYSDRPILGQTSAQGQEQAGGWTNQADRQQQQGQQQGWQQHQPWSQTPAVQAQPASNTPFADASLHRRSATDSDRRATRRTTDDHGDRFVTHTDSGHLIIPPQWEKPERKNSSGLFGKVRAEGILHLPCPDVVFNILQGEDSGTVCSVFATLYTNGMFVPGLLAPCWRGCLLGFLLMFSSTRPFLCMHKPPCRCPLHIRSYNCRSRCAVNDISEVCACKSCVDDPQEERCMQLCAICKAAQGLSRAVACAVATGCCLCCCQGLLLVLLPGAVARGCCRGLLLVLLPGAVACAVARGCCLCCCQRLLPGAVACTVA